jgi:Acetyltransferase (GNAT) domain
MVASSEATPCAHTLFQQSWWLDAVAPNSWDAAVVVENNEVVGRLPFVRNRRFGLTILSQPRLTPFLGPWVNAGTGKPVTRLEREHEILKNLISALPKHDVFIQDFHYSAHNCLPFYWDGFSETLKFSYVLDDLLDHDRLWNGLRKTVRRHIRNAERQLSVRAVDDIEILISMNRMTFERQGLPHPYSPDLLRNLDAACRARGVRRLFLAEGADGTPHAALYLVWDSESAYDLIGGSDSRLRNGGAVSLLKWEAIKYAGQVTRRFDFEGSMLEPIECAFRAFGGRQVQYGQLVRGSTLKGQLALMAKELHSACKRRSAHG